MQTALKSTNVRKEWSRFIDDVTRTKPAIVKRNRDLFAVFSLEQLDLILSGYKITAQVKQEEDGSYSGVFNEIDLMVNASDIESLKTELAMELIEYSEEYMNEFKLYYNSLNRRKHFPYVFKVSLVLDDIEKVKKLFSFTYRSKEKAS